MFWWRKRNEGFEWREYVRTTILVRREQRRQRVKDMQAAAAQHVKDAGKRSVEAGIAGSRGAGAGLWAGAQALYSAGKRLAASAAVLSRRAIQVVGAFAATAAQGLGTMISAAAQRLGVLLAPGLVPAAAWARKPMPSLALKIAAALAGPGAVYRTWRFGFDADAAFAAAIFAVSAGLLLLAFITENDRDRSSGDRRSLASRFFAGEFGLGAGRRMLFGPPGVVALFILGLTVAGGAILHGVDNGGGADPANPITTSALPEVGSMQLEGRAEALTGDTLRVSGALVRLDGIEAPEPAQLCRRKSGAWRCGAAAKSALANLIRRRPVACEVLGERDDGNRARCNVGGVDIAEWLVRNGHVFADGGFWSGYASIEGEAQAQSVGLWSGEADRPQDFRDKRWEEAKKRSPKGCPIKGSVRSGKRFYVVPWAPGYDSLRIRTSRGERWFCTESEAETAGWTRLAPS